MKIIGVDNFNRDTVSDVLVAENVCDVYVAEIIAFLNARFSGENAAYYFKAIDDDRPLYVWKP